MSVSTDEPEHDVRRRAPRWVPAAVALVLVAGAFFGVREVRTRSAAEVRPPAATAPGMPSSAAIEETFGIRFDAVVLTADNGIVQVKYTVLDQAKADELHDTQPWLELADGFKLDQPGISGHGGHSKNTPNAGRSAYVLIANTQSKVHGGAKVTIHLADLQLVGVPVLT